MCGGILRHENTSHQLNVLQASSLQKDEIEEGKYVTTSLTVMTLNQNSVNVNNIKLYKIVHNTVIVYNLMVDDIYILIFFCVVN